ncbi:MAG TPA: type II glyceraldehyde-3-phosphate dehydrogenase [Nitrososphaerales archaeon]|nr:type II glyceraldehyde-3-phosphate dehydrogenase [Nitrososphaerales archaeon]
MNLIRVAVNGYNVIGRRVADAVAAQPDMQLIGVAKVKADYKARSAVKKGYKVYAADEKGRKNFDEAGIQCFGLSRDLVREADIVIDATPEDIGRQNKPMYEELGKKAIFQGGEDHELAGLSFVAQCNYDKARGKQFARVVSCNSTALCRVLHALDGGFGVAKANVVIARRAADPDESGKGPIDSVVLDPASIPSHHGPDVNTVLPNFPVVSMAMKIPTTHMHLHSLIVSMKDGSSLSENKIIDELGSSPRIMFVTSKKDGFKSTANIMDMAREMGRPRNDVYEAVIWKDSIKVLGREVYLFMAVHQEAIVTPENIDAIRAMNAMMSKDDSIRTTNHALGISS